MPGQIKRKRVHELIETSPTLIPAEKPSKFKKRFVEIQNNASIDKKFKHCYENSNNRMSYASTTCKDIIEEQNDENKMKKNNYERSPVDIVVHKKQGKSRAKRPEIKAMQHLLYKEEKR